MNSFYSREELLEFGFKQVGEDVYVSRKASIYGASNISLGNHVRIDDFCILSGTITIGNYVHIAAFAALFAGDAGIVIEDFVCTSSRTVVYAITDDYSGAAMTNPMIPDEYRNVISEKVVLKKHSLIGTSCCVLPGVIVGEGASVGSMSLINKSLEPWKIYVGIPCRAIKERKKDIIEKEKQFLANEE